MTTEEALKLAVDHYRWFWLGAGATTIYFCPVFK